MIVHGLQALRLQAINPKKRNMCNMGNFSRKGGGLYWLRLRQKNHLISRSG